MPGNMRFGARSASFAAPRFLLPAIPPAEKVKATFLLQTERERMNYSCARYELKCNECGRRFGNQPLSACPDCIAPLELAFDLEAVRDIFTRENIAAGP